MSDGQVQQASNAAFAMLAIFGVIGLIVLIFFVIVYWRIFSKAGYPGALGLLMFVPIANLVIILVLAFGEWPILSELKRLRMQVGSQPPVQYPPYNQPGPGPSGPGYPAGPQGPSGPGYPAGPGYPSGPNYPQL
jgi:hypothetical protein